MKNALPIFIKKNLSNLLFIFFILFMLWQKLPLWIEQTKMEGETFHSSEVLDIRSDKKIPLPLTGSAHALIFWSTTCPPCKIELNRINRLIQNNTLDKEKIFAISAGEAISAVLEESQNQGYLFNLVQDDTYQLSKSFNVKGTPTVVLINAQNKVEWMTMGVSPSLELRLINHLK